MQCRRHRIHRFDPRIGKTPWSRKWQPTPVFLAWEIPWTEESGRLQSNGSQRVGQNWATKQQNLKIAFESFYFYYLLYLLLILITSYQTKLIYHNFLSLNLLLEICPVPNDSIIFVGGPKKWYPKNPRRYIRCCYYTFQNWIYQPAFMVSPWIIWTFLFHVKSPIPAAHDVWALAYSMISLRH